MADDYFDDIAANAHDIELLKQAMERLDHKVSAMDKNLFMTLKGLLTLMEDMSFCSMSSDGFSEEHAVRLLEEQQVARQRVKHTLDAMKKVLG